MPEIKWLGIGQVNKTEVDEQDFFSIPVFVQESGIQLGGSPPELRIHSLGIYGKDAFNKQYVAKLNQHTDLPFYLATAKIKIVSNLEKITNEDLKKLNLEPLKD